MDENVKEAKIDFIADLITLRKETVCDKDLIATLMVLKMMNDEMIPDEHLTFLYHILNRFGIYFQDDKVVVDLGMQE